MARRCKNKCGVELQPASKCTDIVEKRGFCSIECLIAHTKEKEKLKAEKEKAKEDQWVSEFRSNTDTPKKAKERIKRLIEWESEAQDAVNRYVRARDYGKSPIGSGKSWSEVWGEEGWKLGGAVDAGHYMSRGAKPQLRFHLLNIWAQSKSDNAGSGKFSHKAATVSEKYRADLIDRIGLERVEWLENNNEKSKKELMCRVDYIEYLKRIKAIFSKRARYYEKLRGIIKK